MHQNICLKWLMTEHLKSISEECRTKEGNHGWFGWKHSIRKPKTVIPRGCKSETCGKCRKRKKFDNLRTQIKEALSDKESLLKISETIIKMFACPLWKGLQEWWQFGIRQREKSENSEPLDCYSEVNLKKSTNTVQCFLKKPWRRKTWTILKGKKIKWTDHLQFKSMVSKLNKHLCSLKIMFENEMQKLQLKFQILSELHQEHVMQICRKSNEEITA